MKRYEKIREHYIKLWKDATAHSVAAFVKYDCPPGSNKNKCGRYRFSDHTSVCNQCWVDYLNQDADETDIDYSNAKHSVRMNGGQKSKRTNFEKILDDMNVDSLIDLLVFSSCPPGPCNDENCRNCWQAYLDKEADN